MPLNQLWHVLVVVFALLSVGCDSESSNAQPDTTPIDANELPIPREGGILDSGGGHTSDASGPATDAAVDASETQPPRDASMQDAQSADGATAFDASSPADAYDHVGPDEGMSSEPLCTQIEACGGEVASSYGVICRARLGDRVTDACFAAVQAAPCSDHLLENAPYMDVCHPPCDVFQNSWCNDDLTASSCFILPAVDSDEVIPRWTTRSCTRVCELGGSVAVECRDLPDQVAQCICEDDL